LPDGQRQLISLVLWKLLASSPTQLPGALETMAKRLQGVLDESTNVPDLAEALDEDYESLDETADEWNDQETQAQRRPSPMSAMPWRRRLRSFGTSNAGDQHPRQRQGQSVSDSTGASIC
jgi:hypothetical protein